MSIRWLPPSELMTMLARNYPAPGLILQPVLHAQVSAEIIRRWTGMAPQTGDWLPGLEPGDAWGGIVNGVPMSILGAFHKDAYRVTVSFPVRIVPGSILDPEFLEALGTAPREMFLSDVHFDVLPFVGDGWGVFANHDHDRVTPIFRSPYLDEAERVVGFLQERSGEAGFLVDSLNAMPLVWVVTGPSIGALISRVEVFQDLGDAERMAQQWSSRTGTVFTVHSGQIGHGAVCAFRDGSPVTT